jgi:hypothetical protein
VRRPGALLALWILALGLAASPARAQEGEPGPSGRYYDLLYDVRVVPTESAARVAIRVGSGGINLTELVFRIDPERHLDFRGDGEIEITEEFVTWRPGGSGTALHYTFLIDHLRDARSYDARITKTWALFRGDDLVPPARTNATTGWKSRSRLRMRVPDSWKRALPYPLISGDIYRVSHPKRRFDRPTGWFVMGQLGSLREEVAGFDVALAGPKQHGMRRLDMLALLRWTLPTLRDVMGPRPGRLLIVGAGDPMWRGGPSGPNSVYVHTRRPLIAEDGTSPVLHEVMHAMLRIHAGPGGDWIVEGLAEYYSLELMRRSGTLSPERIDKAYDRLARRGRSVKELEVDRSSGAVTARAVTVLRQIDAEIQERSEGAKGLDDVVRVLAKQRASVTTGSLIEATGQATGIDMERFIEQRAGR